MVFSRLTTLRLLLLLVLPGSDLFRIDAKSTTSTTLSANKPSAVFGNAVILTATVTPAGTGRFTFYDGSTLLGGAAISAGTAVFSTTALDPGTRKLSARYSGDSNNLPGASPVLTEVITTKPGGFFSYSGSYLSGSIVTSIATADLNHDGFPDIVVASTDTAQNPSPYTLNVLINNGNGTFKSPVGYLAGFTATQVTIADINLDGNLDLVISGAGGAAYLSGKGDGAFLTPTRLLDITDAGIVRVADVNSDGYPDLIVAHTASPVIEVRLGNGDGTFQSTIPATSTLSSAISDLVVGDFNGDGFPDLASASAAGKVVSVQLGVGDGTFSSPALYPCDAVKLATADINGDGFGDLVVGGTTSLTVLPGIGNGTFGPPIVNPLASGANQIAITDIDADGIPDVLGAGMFGSYGNGDGTFRAAIGFASPSALLAMADFNGDGIVDLASTDPGFMAGVGVAVNFGKLAPVLRMTAVPNPVNAGANLTLTVTSGATDATGTVTLSDNAGGATLGSTSFSSGSAAFNLTPARGLHLYQANYAGDNKYSPALTPVLPVTAQQPIGIALTASPNPARPGQTITLTATLSYNPGNA